MAFCSSWLLWLRGDKSEEVLALEGAVEVALLKEERGGAAEGSNLAALRIGELDVVGLVS